MNILVTGGAGFIGSHTCVELLNQNHSVIIIDNFSNSKRDVIRAIAKITNNNCNMVYHEVDLMNQKELESVFCEHLIDLVIHFAGVKSVSESISNPLKYYNENITMTLNLLHAMQKFDCKSIIFSSSATVYGTPQTLPLDESASVGLNITNPYGKTKYFQEEILKDLYKSDKTWSITILRYFNPVGAHSTGLIGEDPNGISNNLMPIILNVATGKIPRLKVFGENLRTIDGTCIRDFIHVVDLAKGHVCALSKANVSGVHIYNVGTGKGTSVKEFIETFERVNEVKLTYEFDKKREGDIEEIYSSVAKIQNELKWFATLTIEDMCKSSWNFVKVNQDNL